MRAIIRNDDDRDRFILYILNAKTGREYEATYRIHRKTRSLAQNKLLWLWLHCIADETGNDPQALYSYFCMRYLQVQTEVVFGLEVMKPGGSSKLNTEEFTKFLDCIKQEMNDQGIYLPEPGQIGFDEMELTYKEKASRVL
jgi:hypothetical protein